MQQQGIRVLRFTRAQVEHETQNVIDQIDEALLKRPMSLTPNPSPREFG